jgi:hypothetical protein
MKATERRRLLLALMVAVLMMMPGAVYPVHEAAASGPYTVNLYQTNVYSHAVEMAGSVSFDYRSTWRVQALACQYDVVWWCIGSTPRKTIDGKSTSVSAAIGGCEYSSTAKRFRLKVVARDTASGIEYAVSSNSVYVKRDCIIP